MRLLVIADIGDLLWKHGVGEADILLSCGDVSDHVLIWTRWSYGIADAITPARLRFVTIYRRSLLERAW